MELPSNINRLERIKGLLRAKLTPQHLEISDESYLHASHEEAQKSSGGHYSVIIIAKCFSGKSTLARHRTIYEILKNEFKENIHAVSIKALTPEEWEKQH